jgi:hypothetical protein
VPTRIQVFKVLADEIGAFARRFQNKDPKAPEELERYLADTLGDRLLGEWASFEQLVADVQDSLTLANVGCDTYDETFTKTIVKKAAKLRDRAAGKKLV